MLETLGSWPGAILLQRSGTAYLFVNAAHILGIALLVGAILPLDLRLLGLSRRVPLSVLGPFLTRTAGTGLGLALVTGAWLFTVRPAEYVANTAFLAKMGLLAAAAANVAVQHRNLPFGSALDDGNPPLRVRALAGLSATLWLAILVAGRWIGFV